MDEAAPAALDGWADELPAELRRELADLLDGSDTAAIWEAAQRLALESVTAAES